MKVTIVIEDKPNADDPQDVAVSVAFDPPITAVPGFVSPAASLAVGLLEVIEEGRFGPVVNKETTTDS